MNQTLETYLRIFVNHEQDDLFDPLPLAEFAYNTRQEPTQMSPFYANYGFPPRFLAEFTPTPIPAANDFASHLRDVHDRLVENVKKARDYQARYYDRKHKPVEFKPSDLVWFNSSNISTTRPSKKLDCWKQLGPFTVLKRIGLQAYRLDLPLKMRHIHNVFHVSLLEPYMPSTLLPHGLPPPLPPLYVKDSPEYFEIENVLGSHRVRNRIQYLIKWKGYANSNNSREHLASIPARGLIKEFHCHNPNIPRISSSISRRRCQQRQSSTFMVFLRRPFPFSVLRSYLFSVFLYLFLLFCLCFYSHLPVFSLCFLSFPQFCNSQREDHDSAFKGRRLLRFGLELVRML